MALKLERDYRVTCEVYKDGHWRKDGALCVAKTGKGAIKNVKSRALKGYRIRNCKAKRGNTWYGHSVSRGRVID